MDYGKFRYEQSKKEREARRNQRQAEIKEIRLKPKTDDHDLEVKSNQARRFLLRGDKVKFTVRFRGREIFHPDIGREMLEQIAEALQDTSVIEQRPLMEGRALSLVLAPNAKALKEAQRAQRAAIQRAAEQRNADRNNQQAAQAAPTDDDDLDDELENEDFDDDIEDDEDED